MDRDSVTCSKLNKILYVRCCLTVQSCTHIENINLYGINVTNVHTKRKNVDLTKSYCMPGYLGLQ